MTCDGKEATMIALNRELGFISLPNLSGVFETIKFEDELEYEQMNDTYFLTEDDDSFS